MNKPTCGVCGREITEDFFEPPTFVLQREPGTNRVRPVLPAPIRMDPETGAICWCPDTAAPGEDCEREQAERA